MNYSDTVNWMFSQLPMYQRKGKSAYKADLSNTLKLSSYLNNPETKFRSVHVAGTNGKGSTSHMLASILQEAGYTVGLYTSPHLKDFRERIKINGYCISKQAVIGFIKRNRVFLEENSLSFFEMTVGMAFDYFAKKKVDIAIIEVGLGGRLDSTNIIIPEVSVITNIGLDHTQFLGDNLVSIAKEKAGVIKENVPVVIGQTQNETKPIFEEISQKKSAKIVFADAKVSKNLSSDLKGNYQKYNIKTAIAVIEQLIKKGYTISKDNISDGLLHVVNNTGLLGRWQVLQDAPKVVCDTAHNKEGLFFTLKQIQEEKFGTLHLVLGFVHDKNLNTILPLFPKDAKYYFCKPKIERGLNAKILRDEFLKFNIEGTVFESVKQAVSNAKNQASKEDFIYVGGSTFVVAEVV